MMSSTNDGDPFIQVQEDAIALLANTRQIFSSYLRIRSLASTSTSPELSSARSEVLASLEDLTSDLEDLHLVISECERDPYRFGLEIQEVAARRRWLGEIEGEVGDMKEEVEKEEQFIGKSSSVRDGKQKGRGGGTGNGDGGYNGEDEDGDTEDRLRNDPYSQNEQIYQQEMMREQDEQLESVYRTVKNLGMQAGDMGRELEEQNVIIDEAEHLAARVEGKLKKGMKNLNTFVKKNEDRWSGCCISLLILVLIILLVLLIIV